MKNQFGLIIALALAALPAGAQSRTDLILNELNDPESGYVAVIAHRGDWRNWPENSIPAIESAIAMGCDAVEVDAARTKDGVLVICHDATIDRTTAGKGKIEDLTYEEIRSHCMRAGNNIRKRTIFIPTLSEVMDVCKDKCLINIDKGFLYYDEILAMAKEKGMTEQIIINSKANPKRWAAKYSQYKDNLKFAPIMNYDKEKWPTKSVDFSVFTSNPTPFFAYEIVWDGSLDGVEKVIEKARATGSLIWLNTLWVSMCGGKEAGMDDDAAFYDPAGVYGKFLGYGPRIVLTERPKLFIEYLNSIGRHTLK